MGFKKDCVVAKSQLNLEDIIYYYLGRKKVFLRKNYSLIFFEDKMYFFPSSIISLMIFQL